MSKFTGALTEDGKIVVYGTLRRTKTGGVHRSDQKLILEAAAEARGKPVGRDLWEINYDVPEDCHRVTLAEAW